MKVSKRVFRIPLLVALAVFATLLIINHVIINQDYEKTEDRIYKNGQIISLENGSDAVDAMFIKDGKVFAIGDSQDILKLQTDLTEIIDLQGKVILPGFIDSHSHVALSSFFNNMVDLSGFTHSSDAAIWDYFSKHIETTEKDEWVIGKGIDSILVDDLNLPTKQFLDKVAPNNPVILISQSIHTYWANSRAFEAVGISKQTLSPSQSSYYEKDEQGNLTGVIKEQAAFTPFYEFLKEKVLTSEVLIEATTKTLKDYAKNGNTSVVSMGISINDKKPLRLYDHLSSETTSFLNNSLAVLGLLPKRSPYPRHFIYIRYDRLSLLPKAKSENDFFNILGVKHWYDGSPYTGSMYLSEPYMESDLTHKEIKMPAKHRGEALVSKDELSQFIKTHHNKGWQVAIHAQGDSANQEVIQAFEDTGLDFTNTRHRIEHCLLLSASDMNRLNRLNLLPNFHINHLLYYGDALKTQLLGEQRTDKILALAEAQKAGIKFSMHADQPMFESHPFRLIQTAVERKTKTGVEIAPNQKISVLDAIKAMTINAAYGINMEQKIGTLKAGKYADFIILDKNPFLIATDDLADIKILNTYVNGNEINFSD